jgi:protein O-GlcNAc transferase
MLRSRFMRTIPEVMDRVLFLPFAESLEQFRNVLFHTDAILDTFHHGGATTCNICFSVGAPVVGLMGKTCRGRGPSMFYQLMNIEGCLAYDPSQYVNIALRLAQDPSYKRTIVDQIQANLGKVYQDNDNVPAAYLSLFDRLSE